MMMMMMILITFLFKWKLITLIIGQECIQDGFLILFFILFYVHLLLYESKKKPERAVVIRRKNECSSKISDSLQVKVQIITIVRRA